MIAKADKKDINRLLEIWESAVLATHHFLAPSDFDFFKAKMPFFLTQVDIYKYVDEEENISAFLGVNNNSIEMLFVDNEARSKGIGKKLIYFAIEKLEASKVDVNEQNEQAFGFYEHLGFKFLSKDDVDGFGKPYPIIHLTL